MKESFIKPNITHIIYELSVFIIQSDFIQVPQLEIQTNCQNLLLCRIPIEALKTQDIINAMTDFDLAVGHLHWCIEHRGPSNLFHLHSCVLCGLLVRKKGGIGPKDGF